MSRNNLPDSDILLILLLQNKYTRTFPGTERSCNKQAQEGACSGCSWRDDVWWRRTLLHIIIINNVSTLGFGGPSRLLLGLVWPGLIIPELQPNFSRFVNCEGPVVVLGSFWGYLIAFSFSWDSKGHQQLWASEKWFNKLSPLCSKTRKVLIVPKIYHHFIDKRAFLGDFFAHCCHQSLPLTAVTSWVEDEKKWALEWNPDEDDNCWVVKWNNKLFPKRIVNC